ncbi:MAG TPA: FtsX-like permease family protein [Streptosporangiaceae bacterium]
MSAGLLERPAPAGAPGHGGVPARRAVIRWAWRLLRREWRQQLLVLGLVTVAVAATIVGAAVATDTPPAANAGFGTAQDQATFQAPDRHLATQIAALQHHFGRVDVIENQTIAIPGSIDTYDLRAQNPHGPYGQPMLSLVSGHYPAGPGQVAVTSGVAATFGLKVGDLWHQDGSARRVTGIVQNPQSLLDEFALVVPGQVAAPTQVTVLFDARGVPPGKIGPNVSTPHSASSGNVLNPETILLALVTIGMLLIALVGIGGFTVLAQRRLRSLGLLAAQGATDRNIRLVVRANGVLVGIIGAVAGFVLGLAAWLAYRPSVELDAHHLIGAFQLPWTVIGVAMGLAVIATFFAASRPARSITRIPVVTALSGRPAPPKQVHRSALPGLILLGGAAVLFAFSGTTNGNGNGALELVLGFVALMAAVILLAPACLALLARLGRRAPIAARLALRDLARYRARSGSALAAITLGVLIAVLVSVLSAQRFGNVLDYAGPNLASDQLIVYTPNGQGGGGPGDGPSGPVTGSKLASMAKTAHAIAAALGSHDVVELESANASLQHAASGRSWNGPVYVATPQLLRAFGISASQVSSRADILSMRPGLSGISKMQLPFTRKASPGTGPGPGGGNGPGSGQDSFPCPKNQCLANPVIQEVSALPSGTSAPNTVITEHAISTLGLRAGISADGWLIQAPNPPTAGQITNARASAAAAGLTIETKNSIPSVGVIIDWATVFGIVLALGILAMTLGLIRSETAGDLRTLAATGASGWTRRMLTAVTAGALGLAGAVLGTVAAYTAAIGYAWDNKLDSLSELTSVPTTSLLLILVGMPLAAAVAGWLLAGREPAAIAHQPME